MIVVVVVVVVVVPQLGSAYKGFLLDTKGIGEWWHWSQVPAPPGAAPRHPSSVLFCIALSNMVNA